MNKKLVQKETPKRQRLKESTLLRMRDERLGYQTYLINELGENYEEKANIGVYF
jgi:hypothetical protein